MIISEDLKLDKKIVNSFKLNDTLCPFIFTQIDNDYRMNPEINKKLLRISDFFLNFLGVQFFVHDIVLTGSLANYNWSTYSDVDLHIMIDYKDTHVKEKLLKEFFDSKKNEWNTNHSIKIGIFDVELYVQDIDERHTSTGVYSILHNEWVTKPKKEKITFEDSRLIKKSQEYSNQIDKLSVDDVVGAERLKKKIKNFRQSGLETDGEFSFENMVFKLLRRNGSIAKLLKIKNKSIDKELSFS